MDSIFHEKQEGCLCAQHCLNALLQGPYFNAVDLANLAHQMDEEERKRMAESGVDSDEYRRFMQQPSENMDDSGYFSVQVISSALKVWNLELVPYNSTEPTALIAKNDPSRMQAYICNYRDHWFTIRKLGNQWFDLNSTLDGPDLLSDTYLSMYIAQLITEGYSIFIVIGDLPACAADDVIRKNPVKTTSKSKPQAKPASVGYRLGTAAEDERRKIQQAVAALERVQVPSSSLAQSSSGAKPKEKIIPIVLEDDDDEAANLEKALQLSLQDEESDKSLKLRLNSNSKSSPEEEEDDELRKALQLSLECVTAPTTPDPDDIRWRRLAFLNNLARSSNESKLNS